MGFGITVFICITIVFRSFPQQCRCTESSCIFALCICVVRYLCYPHSTSAYPDGFSWFDCMVASKI